MRILIVSHYYSEHRGGIEIVAGELAERLTSREINVVWAASRTSIDQNQQQAGNRIPMEAWNITERILGFPYPLWGPIGLIRLWKAVRQCDLVHSHDSLYMGNFVAYVYARLLGKPVAVTQHIGMVPYSHRLLRGLLTFANHTLASQVLRGCDCCIFISEKVQLYFMQFVRFSHAPLFIPNGIAAGIFYPVDFDQRQRLRKERGLPIDKRLILFVGRFVEKKGLSILRILAEHFPACEWVFIGWGPLDPMTWDLPNVRCLGSLERSEVVPYYQGADLFVLPSVGEGFPLVVQEAMACGTPTLISEDTAQGMAGIESVAYVSDLTPENIISLLRVILNAPPDLEARRQQVASFARQHWDWDICADRYRQLFGQLTK
jgi:glycosyltransferase involved in cell wall biosynthesis